MSAIGTALGPSLGGVLIAGFGWRSIFLINVPLGILAWVFSRRYLPEDRRKLKAERTDLDIMGSLWLASSLGAYALAMTMGRGSFGVINGALLLTAGVGLSLFLRTEAKAASPLIQLKLFRDPVLSASLAMSTLVATVIMATLIVGPFYLSRTLGLQTSLVGLLLPLVRWSPHSPPCRRAGGGPVWSALHDHLLTHGHDRRFSGASHFAPAAPHCW